jgi:hypothetical protein
MNTRFRGHGWAPLRALEAIESGSHDPTKDALKSEM